MIQRIEQEMGGTPENVLQNYYNLSPYSFSDTTQTAIKKIQNLPIRIYVEPDISWWINERSEDVSGMNLVDCSAMINELKLLGNSDANLVLTTNKGYRQPGNKRHPHAWSIANSTELVNWLLKQR